MNCPSIHFQKITSFKFLHVPLNKIGQLYFFLLTAIKNYKNCPHCISKLSELWLRKKSELLYFLYPLECYFISENSVHIQIDVHILQLKNI